MEKENINTNMEEQPHENGTEISVEKKLGDLMLRGWIMLEETCPIESKLFT
jgi:hypothetical protein